MFDPATLLKLLIILAGGFILLKVVSIQLKRLVDKEILTEQRFIVVRILLRWIIVVGVILLILQDFGINASQVLTALSAVLVLLAVGFVAVWSVMSNITCAILLLMFPPFRFGDEVELREPDRESGIRGKVLGLNLFYTTLQFSDDKIKTLIRVPNTMFFQRVIICHEGTETHELKLQNVDSTEQK